MAEQIVNSAEFVIRAQATCRIGLSEKWMPITALIEKQMQAISDIPAHLGGDSVGLSFGRPWRKDNTRVFNCKRPLLFYFFCQPLVAHPYFWVK